jgi:hypothetical protein
VRNRRLHASARSIDVECVDGFDDRFDPFWDDLVKQRPDMLVADRSRLALSWHFGIPMRRGRLWVFTACRGGRLRAYCAFVRKGDGRQAYLADYQTIDADVDVLPAFLGAALTRCAREGVYLLRNVGRGVPKMRAFDDHAPYRSRHASWKFYFRAGDPGLDAALHDSSVWDPSLYDGDASFD